MVFLNTKTYADPKARWIGFSFNGSSCEGEETGYGPYDFIDPKTRSKFLVVEKYHFTKKVELLRAGRSGTLPSDLDYTLRAVPNHHRALLSVIRYQIKYLNKLKRKKLLVPPECYLQRAINFNPKDAALYVLYGYYLEKNNRLKEASRKYKKALLMQPNYSKFEYAYSLLLIKLKKYNEALKFAKLAYKHGKPPDGLKKKLIKIGVWK